jgi:hypothetical protein
MTLVRQSESYLSQYGDSYKGIGRFKVEQALGSYQTMLEVVRLKPDGEVTLLDFGCGLSHFYQYMQDAGIQNVRYHGLDISEKFLAISREKYPQNQYFNINVLDDDSGLPQFDYVVMNGIFTQKCDLSYEEMWDYFTTLLPRVFRHAEIALAFNVHSKIVDWEREDLFHVPFDPLAKFLASSLTRNFIIRHDYRLYEYTVYVYR